MCDWHEREVELKTKTDAELELIHGYLWDKLKDNKLSSQGDGYIYLDSPRDACIKSIIRMSKRIAGKRIAGKPPTERKWTIIDGIFVTVVGGILLVIITQCSGLVA